MKFIMSVASQWYIYDYTMQQLELLKASKEDWDKYSLDSFNKNMNRIKETIEKYTSIPLKLEEVNYLIRFNDGKIDKHPKVRYVAEINTLEQLQELSKNCNIIIDNESYDIPVIKYYDSYIE